MHLLQVSISIDPFILYHCIKWIVIIYCIPSRWEGGQGKGRHEERGREKAEHRKRRKEDRGGIKLPPVRPLHVQRNTNTQSSTSTSFAWPKPHSFLFFFALFYFTSQIVGFNKQFYIYFPKRLFIVSFCMCIFSCFLEKKILLRYTLYIIF